MTKAKRRLIFHWTYVEWGGAQIYLLTIMKRAKADWDIVVVLPRNSQSSILAFLDQIGVSYEFIDTYTDTEGASTIPQKIHRQWRRIQAEIVSFRHLIRYNLRECVLHTETAPWQSWIFLTALSLRRANVFVTLHNALPMKPAWRTIIWKARMQWVSRLPGFHIFAANQHAKDQFRGWVKKSFWENIKVTYAIVDRPEI